MPRGPDANPDGVAAGDAAEGRPAWRSAARPPWPLPIAIDLSETANDERADAAQASLRARPGVAVLASSGQAGTARTGTGHTGTGHAETVLVSAGGDLRAFVSGRLRGEGPRADLSAVVDAVWACECGSGFEADLACDALARELMPEAAALAAANRAVSFVHLDPGDRAPACRVIDEGAKLAGLDPATLIGPFAARAHAEAWAALLESRFELCREPRILAGRPDAEACSYKDMGLCPAPCDGSEPMDAYVGRVRAALAFDGAALETARTRVAASIEEASKAMDFERAGSLKKELAALDGARTNGSAWATTMDRFGAVGVMPAGKAGWARVFVHRSGVTRMVCDVRVDTKGKPAGNAGSAAGLVVDLFESFAGGEASAASAGAGFSNRSADGVALLARHAWSARKTNGRILPLHGWAPADAGLDAGGDRADLTKAISSALRRAAGRTRRASAGENVGGGVASGGDPIAG